MTRSCNFNNRSCFLCRVVATLGQVKKLGVARNGVAGDYDLLDVAGLAGDLAAPFKLTLAGGHHFHNLLLHMEPTGVAEVGALPDLFSLVFAVGVHLTSFPNNPFVPKLCIQSAIVWRRLEEHQLSLVYLHFLSCD